MRQNLLGEGKVLCQRLTPSESICLKRNIIIKQRTQKGSNYFQTEKIKLWRGGLELQRIRGLVSMREGGWRDDVEWQDYGTEEVFNLYTNFTVHLHQRSLLSAPM